MEIHTTARHFDLTPELRAHVEDRLSRVDRFVARPSEARVVLEVEKYRHVAAVTLKVDGRDLVARGLSADMYTSVDQAVDKILEQVKRRRDAALSRRRKGGKDAAAAGTPGEEPGDEELDADEAEA
jgi:putative sigma-54 modulation protein